MREITFYWLPLSVPYETLAFLDEELLNIIITDYSQKLMQEKQIETFKIVKNIAVTELGYVFAFPEDKLVEIKNPTPV